MIGVLVGLHAESRLLPAGVAACCSGGRADRSRRLVAQLIADGCTGILSFGIAGGLKPGLRPGQLIVGSDVDLEGVLIEADRRWSRRLVLGLPEALSATIAGVEEAVTTPAAKHALWQSGGALAVDMESAAVAEACAAAGKPFAVLRAVADPAERSIPELALAGLGDQGAMRPAAVAAGLIRRPWELPALIRLGLDSQAALQALSAAVQLLGDSLGF